MQRKLLVVNEHFNIAVDDLDAMKYARFGQMLVVNGTQCTIVSGGNIRFMVRNICI